jgi:hypothetical protein
VRLQATRDDQQVGAKFRKIKDFGSWRLAATRGLAEGMRFELTIEVDPL